MENREGWEVLFGRLRWEIRSAWGLLRNGDDDDGDSVMQLGVCVTWCVFLFVACCYLVCVFAWGVLLLEVCCFCGVL